MYTPSHSDALSAGRRFPGLQRLISIALADTSFANAILADPAHAIQNMPAGVSLTSEERHLVSQVRGAPSLAHFAAYLDVLMRDALQEQ